MVRHIALCLITAALLSGCTEPKHEPTHGERALSDPMNYKPNAERQDVSGGGILEYDRKAVRKDLDNVLSP